MRSNFANERTFAIVGHFLHTINIERDLMTSTDSVSIRTQRLLKTMIILETSGRIDIHEV